LKTVQTAAVMPYTHLSRQNITKTKIFNCTRKQGPFLPSRGEVRDRAPRQRKALTNRQHRASRVGEEGVRQDVMVPVNRRQRGYSVSRARNARLWRFLSPKGGSSIASGQPVENGEPPTAEPPQGATERFDDEDEDDDEKKRRAPTKNHISLSHPEGEDRFFTLDLPAAHATIAACEAEATRAAGISTRWA